MVEITRTQMISAEFLELPETMTPTQLIDGEVIVSPAPEPIHQDAVLNAADMLKRVIPNGKVRISPIDVWLGEVDVVQPDVLWTAKDGQCKLSENKKHLAGAPELIVEVFSPGMEKLDRGKKFDLYEKYGVKEYWMVHPHLKYVEIQARAGKKFERIGVFGAEDTIHSALLDKDVELKALFAE